MDPMRAEKSGLAAEAQNKILEKFDKETSMEAMKWIERVTGETLDYDGTWEQFIAILKDGKLLCKLANTLKPGSIKKVQNSKLAFMQRENINFFHQFIEKDAGIRADENFQTVDLFEGTNPYAVLITICALARKSEKVFGVSGFGPKESERQAREWTEEQIRAGDGIIGLQAGSNAGASQAGMNIGYLSRPQLQKVWSFARIRCFNGENESETFRLAGQKWFIFRIFLDVERSFYILKKVMSIPRDL